MIIGALNSTHSVKSNDSRVKNQNLISAKQNQTNSATNPTIENGNYGKETVGLNKKFKPSFGFEPIILAYAALYIGTVAYACYKTSVDDKKRAEEAQKVEKEKQPENRLF